MNQKCFFRRIIRSCSKTSSLLSDLKLSVKSRLNYKSWDSQDGVFCHHFCHHCQPLVNGERTFASSQFSKHFPNLTVNVCFILSVKQSADHLFYYLKCYGNATNSHKQIFYGNIGLQIFHEYDSGWNPWENVLYLFKACLPKWLISRGKEVFENTW